uniref:Uncharacterized protein n=1 Tax=Caenorhabditis japonica TaxID=281687 RepID=A0A8R1ILU6_CAEJA
MDQFMETMDGVLEDLVEEDRRTDAKAAASGRTTKGADGQKAWRMTDELTIGTFEVELQSEDEMMNRKQRRKKNSRICEIRSTCKFFNYPGPKGQPRYSRRRICILEAKRAWYTVGRNSKKRNAAPEPESDSDGSQFNFDNAIEDKPMGKSLDAMEVDEQESDGDDEKELQAAFAAGPKTD